MLTAEGEKKAYTLQSEGVKIQLINESEGKLIQVQNAAKADKERIRLEAEVGRRPASGVLEGSVAGEARMVWIGSMAKGRAVFVGSRRHATVYCHQPVGCVKGMQMLRVACVSRPEAWREEGRVEVHFRFLCGLCLAELTALSGTYIEPCLGSIRLHILCLPSLQRVVEMFRFGGNHAPCSHQSTKTHFGLLLKRLLSKRIFISLRPASRHPACPPIASFLLVVFSLGCRRRQQCKKRRLLNAAQKGVCIVPRYKGFSFEYPPPPLAIHPHCPIPTTQGEAEARLVKAKAEAEALTMVAEALKEAGGADAAQLQIAKQYIDMYGEMGKSSNTMLFSDRPADVNALIAQVFAVRYTAPAPRYKIPMIEKGGLRFVRR